MNNGQRLVVVDGVPETVQVLRAVFEPRGHQVDRVRAFEFARLADEPDGVLVLHDDGARPPATSNGRVPRVIIGSIAAAAESDRLPDAGPRLSQPFHYAELIRAVESLLAEGPEREAV